MSGIIIHASISDTTSITMTNNVHGRLAIRMSIVFLRVIFVTCSNREIYADVYMAQVMHDKCHYDEHDGEGSPLIACLKT